MCGGVLVQVNYFHFVAEEVRAGLASLGMRSMDELIGRGDLLRQRSIKLAKTEGLDLSFLTHYAGETATSSSRGAQEVNIPPRQFTWGHMHVSKQVVACLENVQQCGSSRSPFFSAT